MKIAVLKESAPGETRVAATPETVKKITALGHSVTVQTGAGAAASYPDDLYSNAGGEVVGDGMIGAADLVLKVRRPTDAEIGAMKPGAGFASPKVGRGAAYGDYDRDGDVDLLITTNRGPALLYRNDVTNGNKSLRLRLIGTKSNRDGIGAIVRLTTADGTQSRMVKSGGSYLSQSELPLTFGLGQLDHADEVTITWSSDKVTILKNLKADRSYRIDEDAGMKP